MAGVIVFYVVTEWVDIVTPKMTLSLDLLRLESEATKPGIVRLPGAAVAKCAIRSVRPVSVNLVENAPRSFVGARDFSTQATS